MTSEPIIVITGATGVQGGSVIRALQATGKFKLRAVSRNPESDASKALIEKGVEVVQGNANDGESMKKAFTGAWGAFLVTNFWDPAAKGANDTDLVQGKLLVDAAKEAGIQYIVWSSLEDIQGKSNGKLLVPHFSYKNKVEQYIRSIGFDAAFVYAGYYASNWIGFPQLAGPLRNQDGSIVIHSPFRDDVKIPIIDMDADFGKFVAPAFLDPVKFHHKKIMAASEYITVPQMVEAYTSVTGEEITVNYVPFEKIMEIPNANMLPPTMFHDVVCMFNDLGYFVGAPLEPTQALYDHDLKLNSFKDWIRTSGFKVPPPSAPTQ
ncbi:hypothetical protein O0I10_012488 [Lichtheimia ornata]|uniref:NmrA-like domain-containing protein n=1 Tax=Lichtheimia ornata TaxID=688661 RepID=A0AAD7UTD4_9FUNG|nr:uncharacterized protein O0I10_012488 [Lichtheimia ornata]KAJ8651941.1 hypothetical protein O0I10_012488 [Lichtheimia ornata]